MRLVGSSGNIRWQDEALYVSEAPRGQTIGLARRDDGHWAIRFRNFDLAAVDAETRQIRRTGLVRLAQPKPALDDGSLPD